MKALIAIVAAFSGAVVATAAPMIDDTHLAATAEMPDIVAPEERPALPQVEHAGTIAYMNGGAGLDEAGYMKARSREFSLQVIFSGRGGEYGVADRVSVQRGGEEIATIEEAGPYLLMKLPPGRYTVEADFDGGVERRSVTIGQGTQRIDWNTAKASD